MKPYIDYSRNIPRICVQVFGKFLCRIPFLLVFLLEENDVKYLILQLVHQPWTYEASISGFLLFGLCKVILCHRLYSILGLK